MIISKKSLPRRTFLRGMGVTIALPLLDAMVPAVSAMAKTAASPRRLGVIYVPNGMAMNNWTPRSAGADFELPPILQPLAAFRDRLLVLSGLNGERPAGGQSSHAAAATRFLTGVPGRQTADGMEAGPSIDQLAARVLGAHTPLPSLELALDARDISGSCDGASCAFLNTLSWSSANTALPTEHDPRVVFERMFGETGSTDVTVRNAGLRRRRSILDSVTEAVADSRPRFGTERPAHHRRIPDGRPRHRTAHRTGGDSRCRGAARRPAGRHPTAIRRKSAADVRPAGARVSSRRHARDHVHGGARVQQPRTYPEIGVAEAHHPLSHHQNNAEKIALLAKINTYHTTQLASYLKKLQATPDGDGSLLDHTAAALRVGHQRQQPARSRQSPASRGGRVRPRQRRTASPVHRHAVGEPARDDSRQAGRARRPNRQQRRRPQAGHAFGLIRVA